MRSDSFSKDEQIILDHRSFHIFLRVSPRFHGGSLCSSSPNPETAKSS